MFKLDLEKVEEPEIKLSTFIGSWRKQGNSIKTSTSASLTTLKLLTVWVTTTVEKPSRDENTRLPYLSPEKPVFSQEATELDMEQMTQSGSVVQNWERSTSRLYLVTLLI